MAILSLERQWNGHGMGTWFREFRSEHGFTTYGENRTAVSVDVPLLALTYFCVLLSLATLVSTLGIRGKERWSAVLRACYALAVGSIILVCIVGHGWQVGQVGISSPYIYRSNQPFQGSVGIKVGLHGTNVTLEGFYEGTRGKGYVYFVEEVPWAEFGEEKAEYAQYLHRGLPEPLLKVIEFLSTDEGGLRWGRALNSSSHFATMLLWTSFAFWLLTNLLLFSVVVYGAYMFFLTGLTMVLSCMTYHYCQLEQPLVIAFGDADLRFSYGWSYWLALSTGCVTLVLGLFLIILDHFAPKDTAVFFQLEVLDEPDQLENYTKQCSEPGKGDNLNGDSSFTIDRRGYSVPGDLHRGSSIFIDPSRRSNKYNDNLLRSLGLSRNSSQVFSMSAPGSSTFLNKIVEDETANTSPEVKNPLYTDEAPRKWSTIVNMESREVEKAIRSNMECVCEDSQVCASTKKPSLATLKEHRENHANEKLCANTVSNSPSHSDELTTRITAQRKNAFVPRSDNIETASVHNMINRSRKVSVLSSSSSEGGIIISPSSQGFTPAGETPSLHEQDGRFSPIFSHLLKSGISRIEVHEQRNDNLAQTSQSVDCPTRSRRASASSSSDSGKGISNNTIDCASSADTSFAEDGDAKCGNTNVKEDSTFVDISF